MDLRAHRALDVDSQELSVVKHVLYQLKLAINVHKTEILSACIQSCIIAPPGAKLQRATARLFDLKSQGFGKTPGYPKIISPAAPKSYFCALWIGQSQSEGEEKRDV